MLAIKPNQRGRLSTVQESRLRALGKSIEVRETDGRLARHCQKLYGLEKFMPMTPAFWPLNGACSIPSLTPADARLSKATFNKTSCTPIMMIAWKSNAFE